MRFEGVGAEGEDAGGEGEIDERGFPFWERSERLAPHAFFPKTLFKQRTVAVGVTYTFWYYSTWRLLQSRVLMLTPIIVAFYLSVQPYFQSYLLVVQGLSLTAAGHIVQVFNFSSSITAVLVGLAIKYTNHYKYFVTFGSCIYMMGITLMIKYRTQDTSIAALVGTQIAVGIGGGMANLPALVAVQASASHQQVAAATAVFLTMMEIGGAVGAAISGAVWSSNILSKLVQYLPEESKSRAEAIYSSVEKAASSFPKGTPERAAVDRAYQETMHSLLLIAVGICILPIILSLFMSNYKLNQVRALSGFYDLSRH